MNVRISLLSFVCLGSAIFSAQADTYSYAELVGRLTDLKALATPPTAGENTALASSYDRKSQYDDKNDRYIDWGANNDGDGVVRMEGENQVLAEIQGPGCIWRVWSATTKPGHVKIYLDGSPTPAVDFPFTDYFNGTQEPFNRPALVYKTKCNGFDNFTPIPFQKSCKIVGEKGWGQFYHFNYSTFSPGSVVPTFHLPLSATDSAALDHANDVLLHPGQNPNAKSPSDEVKVKQITAEPGKSTTILDEAGPGAITAIRVKFDFPTDIEAQRALLRQLAFRIIWDNQKSPAVWSPLGDFFGSPAAAVPFDSLTTGLDKDGYFYCYWYMPFGTRATLSIDNDGTAAVPMTWEITRAKLTQKPDSLLRFHAKWHRDAFLPARADRKIDWTLLTTLGKGRYVGTQLHIFNPRGGWWGEGDEKFFVDGEKFPSTIGTGSEDYFGYAWSSGGMFSEPLHGQPYTENGLNGHISDFRWHIPDNIPFQTSFEGAIEKYFPNDRPTLFAAVAFWYLDPAGTDPYPVVPASERVGYCVLPPVYHEPDAIEAESLQLINPGPGIVVFKSGAGNCPIQTVSNDTTLGIKLLQIGQKADFKGLKVEKDGKYKLRARMFKWMGSGIYQISVDGTPIGAPVDLYAPRSVTGTPDFPETLFDLGDLELKAGDHILTVTCVGKNEKAVFGRNGSDCTLDYFKLIPE